MQYLEIRRFSYHGVLAHQDYTLTAEGVSDLVHLLGADIVDSDNEDTLVLREETAQLFKVAGLVFGSTAPHIFLL